MPDSKSRAKKIKLLLFDVDGVLTDGKLFFFPAPAGGKQSIQEQAAKHGGQGGFGLHSESFVEAKGYHAHDGAGISLARLGGIKSGLITKRISETVALRARDLKLDYVHQGINDKLGVFKEILKQEQINASEACYVGDDVIDLPVMWNCGFAVAVANARDEVKRDAHYVTKHGGGDGALRDVIEFIRKPKASGRKLSSNISASEVRGASSHKWPNFVSTKCSQCTLPRYLLCSCPSKATGPKIASSPSPR